jgi:hypothetical protein
MPIFVELVFARELMSCTVMPFVRHERFMAAIMQCTYFRASLTDYFRYVCLHDSAKGSRPEHLPDKLYKNRDIKAST